MISAHTSARSVGSVTDTTIPTTDLNDGRSIPRLGFGTFQVPPAEFRTAWFLESMATQILVIFVIRTNGRPWRDRPRPALAVSSLAALVVALALPFTPAGRWFGFEPPPATVLAGIGLVVIAYLAAAELLKPVALRPGHAPTAR